MHVGEVGEHHIRERFRGVAERVIASACYIMRLFAQKEKIRQWMWSEPHLPYNLVGKRFMPEGILSRKDF